MADKEIIIDGVDVSKCRWHTNLIMDCLEIPTQPCKCTNDKNCYYKQLKRQEQKNEKLNEVTIEQRKENTGLTIKLGEMINRGGELYGELQKYKQALDEIEQTISNFPSKGIQDIPQTQIECTQYFLSVSETKLQKILDIMHKAKDSERKT